MANSCFLSDYHLMLLRNLWIKHIYARLCWSVGQLVSQNYQTHDNYIKRINEGKIGELRSFFFAFDFSSFTLPFTFFF